MHVNYTTKYDVISCKMSVSSLCLLFTTLLLIVDVETLKNDGQTVKGISGEVEDLSNKERSVEPIKLSRAKRSRNSKSQMVALLKIRAALNDIQDQIIALDLENRAGAVSTGVTKPKGRYKRRAGKRVVRADINDPMMSINKGRKPPLSMSDRVALLRIKAGVDKMQQALNDLDLKRKANKNGRKRRAAGQEAIGYHRIRRSKREAKSVTGRRLRRSDSVKQKRRFGQTTVSLSPSSRRLRHKRQQGQHSRHDTRRSLPPTPQTMSVPVLNNLVRQKKLSHKSHRRLHKPPMDMTSALMTLRMSMIALNTKLNKGVKSIGTMENDHFNMQTTDIKAARDKMQKLDLDISDRLEVLQHNVSSLLQSQQRLGETVAATIDTLISSLTQMIQMVDNKQMGGSTATT